jgi:hypothetical protein
MTANFASHKSRRRAPSGGHPLRPRLKPKTLCQSQLDDEELKPVLESKPDPHELVESKLEEKSLAGNAELASANT